MDFRFSEDIEQFRQEVRGFVAQEWHPDPTWLHDSPEYLAAAKEFRRKLLNKGWFAMSIPKVYGGSGMSVMQQYIFHGEMSYAEAPSAGAGIHIVAPTLIMVGSEEQKQRFLPPIVNGEMDFCLGYTEPGAGSDLAGLETKAVEDGDDFVINGQKIFTSGAHSVEYCWMAARTDPNVPKHKGISLFMIDMKSPGITIEPLRHMGGHRTNITFWDNVRVPRSNLVGEVNRGWYYVATALDFERVIAFDSSYVRPVYDKLIEYVKEAVRDGKHLKDDSDVRDRIARLSIDFEVGQLLSYRAAWMVDEGTVPNHEASMGKVWNTELLQRVAYWGTQIQGLYGNLVEGSKYVPVHGDIVRVHQHAVHTTIGAGANEVQRNIIAQRGLGMPR